MTEVDNICRFPACKARGTGIPCHWYCTLKTKSQIKKDRVKELAANKKEKVSDDMVFYTTRVWPYRPHTCRCCGMAVGHIPYLWFFHHVLEKRNYKEYRHAVWNIVILCRICHDAWEDNPDARTAVTIMRDYLLELHEKGELDPESELLIV